MINALIDGISIQLNKVFGDKYETHAEGVEQGLEEPCFFIKVLNPNQEQIVGQRYFKNNPFDIHYFPEKDNEECYEVAEKLFEALEYITLLNGDLIRGTDMNYEIINEVLHFFVKFNMHVNKIKTPEDNMEFLKVNNNVG